MEPTLVADVGTAATHARVVAAGQTQTVRHPPEDFWPTAVARDRAGFVVGRAAIGPAIDQGLSRGRFLPALGQRNGELRLGDAAYPAVELLARLLAELRNAAMPMADYEEVNRVLLTVPDGDGSDAARQGRLAAARQAGFDHVELLSEATAATLAAPWVRDRPGLVLVCDLGASALRLTVLRAGPALATDPGRAEHRSVIPALGGDAMDRELAERIKAWVVKRKGNAVADRLTWDSYLSYANQLRHRLDTSADASVSLATLDHSEFPYTQKNLIRLLKDPRRKLTEALRGIRKSYPGVRGVLVVGGCARPWFLSEMLDKELGDAEVLSPPDSAVADGAAVWASHARARALEALPHRPGTRELAWRFKSGGVQVIKWRVRENERFGAGARLAVVRDLAENEVSYLTADFAGTMLQRCVPDVAGPGPATGGRRNVVGSGQVLAIAEIRPTGPEQLCRPYLLNDAPGLRALAFSQDGAELLLRDPGGGCHRRDMRTGATTAMPGGIALRGPGSAVVHSPTAGWRAGIADGQDTRLVSLETGELIRKLKGGSATWFNGDGTCCWTGQGSADGVVLRAWDQAGRSAQELGRTGLYGAIASSAALSRDGTTLLLASRSKAGLFHKRPAGCNLVAWTGMQPRSLGELPALERPAVHLSLAVSPDGGKAVAALGHLIQLWDTGPDPVWDQALPGPVRAAEFSADGSYLVVIGESEAGLTGTLWDTRQRVPAELLQFGLSGRAVAWALLSPDSRFLVTGDERNSTLWGLLP